jgi:hypothetical protein
MAWPHLWRVVGMLLAALVSACWLVGGLIFFFGVGFSRPTERLLAAGAFFALAMVLSSGFAFFGRFLYRTQRVLPAPLDPQRTATLRRAVIWTPISYAALVAGLAWFLIATGQWPGSRGVFLGVSGLMLGVGLGAAALLPFARRIAPDRRGLLGMSFATYTLVSVITSFVVAVLLLVVALLLPPG